MHKNIKYILTRQGLLKKLPALLYASVIILVAIIFSQNVRAEVILQDTFTDTLKIDMAKTSANVDIQAGEVRLRNVSMPNAIAVRQNSNEYAVVTDKGQNFYSYDTGAGKVKLNSNLSITDRADVKGIAMRQDQYSMWLLTEDGVYRYDFDKSSSSMKYNSFLSRNGLQGNISISAYPDKDKVVLLSKSSTGKGIVTTLQGTSEGSLVEIQEQSFDTGLDEPASVSVVPDNEDIVIAAGKGVYYYSFDRNTFSYKLNTSLSTLSTITNDTEAIGSINGRSEGYGYLSHTGSAASFYLYDKQVDKTQVYNPLGVSLPSRAVSVSLKPCAYEYAALLEDGKIAYYKFDENTKSMLEVPEMEPEEPNNLVAQYITPADYHSTVIQSAEVFDEVKVSTAADIPKNTDISYMVSSNGGQSFTNITPGEWLAVPEGNKFCLKAVLSTTDISKTPKLFNIRVETTMLKIENPTVTAITLKHDDQPVPTNTFPVKVKSGAQIVYTVESSGYADTVTAEFSTGENYILDSSQPITNEDNLWTGTYTVPPDFEEGTLIYVEFRERKGTRYKTITVPAAFIIVDSSVVFDINVRLRL